MALASRYPDVEIPDVSVPEFVLAAGRNRPDAPALIDGLRGDVITHGQLAAYVDRVAAVTRGLPAGTPDVWTARPHGRGPPKACEWWGAVGSSLSAARAPTACTGTARSSSRRRRP